MMNRLARQLIQEAMRSVGAREVGRNDGPEVREWLRRVNRKPGSAWCAAFAWCKLDDACTALGLHNPIAPTAGVHLFVARARAAKAWTRVPSPGFLCFHGSGVSKSGAKLGHCGIVIEMDGDEVRSIEGNTNEAGAREGDRVAPKLRDATYWDLGYLDPGLLLAGQQCSEEHPEDG